MEVIAVAECFICEQDRPVGVHIGPLWCCAECEDRIVHSHVETDEYEELIIGMHRLWESFSLDID